MGYWKIFHGFNSYRVIILAVTTPAALEKIMDTEKTFTKFFGKEEREVFARLDSPASIQAFLDEIPYSTAEIYRSPRSVLRDRQAHCFDGALFAAAALRRLGQPPLIIDMLAERDDDHILALYKRDGLWGAVARSNFVGLRFREAIYRTLRELVLSYFEVYYNVAGEKNLRGYTLPLNLKAFDKYHWQVSDDHLESIAQRLDTIRRVSLITDRTALGLSPVDERSYTAGMLGADEAGLYRPRL